MTGKVTAKAVVYTSEAFDIGTIRVEEGKRAAVLHVMNEYMALDDGDGARLATYPDVLTTLGGDGQPVSVGHLQEGMTVYVFHLAKDKIPLSSSVTDPSVYPPVEKALGIDLATYALAG